MDLSRPELHPIAMAGNVLRAPCVRKKRFLLVLAIAIVASATGVAASTLRRPPKDVRVDGLSVEPLATAPPATAASPPPPPRSRKYERGAYFIIREGLTRAAAATRGGDHDQALRILTGGDLARRAGVILESVPVTFVAGPEGSLSSERAKALTASAFDETYAIGSVGHRGILVGTSTLVGKDGASVFERPEDRARFATYHVLAAMTAWIGVWQDTAGNRPVSTITLEYIRERKDATAWASVDELAVLGDLGVAVPPELLTDARFPAWAAFTAWRGRRDAPRAP